MEATRRSFGEADIEPTADLESLRHEFVHRDSDASHKEEQKHNAIDDLI